MDSHILNADKFRKGLISGARYVIEDREHLNSINVYPVADSDTGTNMADTVQSVMSSLIDDNDDNLSSVSRKAAEAALMGARGNSGIILAQFIHELAEEFKHDITVTAQEFGEAAQKAVARTYKSILHPREGTILSVMKEWAHSFTEWCHLEDFTAVQKQALARANRALENTRKQLRELSRADVVDAGGRGFFRLMEGFYDFLKSGIMPEVKQGDWSTDTPDADFDPGKPLTFRYCTECLIIGTGIDTSLVKDELKGLGDSLIVGGSSTTGKVHIHTDNPEQVFSLLERHGQLTGLKVDDMLMQYQAAHDNKRQCLVVVDSGADIPTEVLEEHSIPFVPMNIRFNDQNYIDKLGLSTESFFSMMQAHPEIVPTTSQPAPGTFRRLFANLAPYYKGVVYLGISGGLSGTLRSAGVARDMLPGVSVSIVDSKNLSIGQGLIAAECAKFASTGATVEEVARLAEDLAERTTFYAVVPDLAGMLRSGRIGKRTGKMLQVLGLRPVLCMKPSGKAGKGGIYHTRGNILRKLVAITRKNLKGQVPVALAVGHVDVPEQAEKLKQELMKKYPGVPVMVSGIAAALSAHGRKGVLAVSWIEPSSHE